MLTRRLMLAAAPAAIAAPAPASANSFESFVSGVRAEARKAGISAQTLDAAFAGVSPNQKVIERDRRQVEFTMTWVRYRNLVITDKRIEEGRKAIVANRDMLNRVVDRFNVSPRVITGIWTLQDAKSRLSEVLRRARTDGPQRLTVHGRESAVVLSVEEFRRLKGEGPTGQMLVDALRAAPYPEIDLDVARHPSPMRHEGL